MLLTIRFVQTNHVLGYTPELFTFDKCQKEM